MLRGAPRALRALLTAGVVGLLAAVPAAAAGGSVGVTGIEVKSGNLVGLISSANGADIDPSLQVTVAGKTYPVDAITSGQGSPVSRTTIIVVDTSGSMGTSGMATVRSA